jgi:signal transduction histidine kinase
MVKGSQVSSIMNWVKLFTYISATVLLIIDNNFDQLTYLIPLVFLIFLINYSRDYYLIAGKKPIQYVWISLALEILLIICLGFFDKTGINILFFFVCISSTVISHPFIYSIPLVIVYIASEFFIYAERNGLGDLAKSMVPMLFSYGVSTVFVIGMSYLVKMQGREKEKQARINDELEQAYEKLIENSAAAQKLTVEQERTRMAREIHDTLAHTLTTLIVQLEACKKLASLDPSRLPTELEKAQELSRSGFNDIKRSIKALRPQVMEDKSFFASILSIINDTMENTKVHITLNNFLPQDIKRSSQIEVALFRVIQESITNSIRHGQATEIEVTLKEDSNRLEVLIVDNGIGCSTIKKGYGIQGIGERIESLKGSAEFSSSHGKGFKTEVSIPQEGV